MSRYRFYQKSKEPADFSLFDYRLLLDSKTIHQPSVLLHGDGLYFGLIPRPAEFSVRKPFVEKQETIALIKKCFYPVSPSSAEKEETMKLFLEENNPASVLKKGYSMLEDMSGKVVSSVKDIKDGERYILALKDGRIIFTATDTDVEKTP